MSPLIITGVKAKPMRPEIPAIKRLSVSSWTQDAAARRTERGAQRDLFLSSRSLREQQARRVSARDHQHEQRSDEHDAETLGDPVGHETLSVILNAHSPARRGLRVCPLDSARYAFHVGLRLKNADALPRRTSVRVAARPSSLRTKSASVVYA